MDENRNTLEMERCASCNALDCDKPIFGFIDGEFLCRECFFMKDNDPEFAEQFALSELRDLAEQTERTGEGMIQFPTFTLVEGKYCQVQTEDIYEEEEYNSLEAQFEETERRSIQYSLLEAQYEESQRRQPEYSLIDLSDVPSSDYNHNPQPPPPPPPMHYYNPQGCCMPGFNPEAYNPQNFIPQNFNPQNFNLQNFNPQNLHPQLYHCQNFTTLPSDQYSTKAFNTKNNKKSQNLNTMQYVNQHFSGKRFDPQNLNLQSLSLAEEETYPRFIKTDEYPCPEDVRRKKYKRVALQDPREMCQEVPQVNNIPKQINLNVQKVNSSKKMVVEEHTIALHNLVPQKTKSLHGRNPRPSTPTIDNDVETCSNRAVACDDTPEESANTRRPLICPVSDCGRMVALTSMVAHFKCEHPRVAFLIVRFGGTKHLAVDTNILPYDETRCVALVLVDPNAIKKPLNTSNVEADSAAASAGMSTFGSAGTSSTYPSIYVPPNHQTSSSYPFPSTSSGSATDPQTDSTAPANFGASFIGSEFKPITTDNFEKYKDFIPMPLMVAKIRAEFSDDEEETTKDKPKPKRTNTKKYRSPKTKGQLNLAQPTQLEHEMEELDKFDVFAVSSSQPDDEALPMEITVNDVIVLWIAGITSDVPYSYTITAFNTQQTRHMSFRGPIHNLRDKQSGYHLCSTTDSMIIYHAMLRRLTNNGTQSVELQVTIHDKNK